jgi:hypothetical protein
MRLFCAKHDDLRRLESPCASNVLAKLCHVRFAALVRIVSPMLASPLASQIESAAWLFVGQAHIQSRLSA